MPDPSNRILSRRMFPRPNSWDPRQQPSSPLGGPGMGQPYQGADPVQTTEVRWQGSRPQFDPTAFVPAGGGVGRNPRGFRSILESAPATALSSPVGRADRLDDTLERIRGLRVGLQERMNQNEQGRLSALQGFQDRWRPDGYEGQQPNYSASPAALEQNPNMIGGIPTRMTPQESAYMQGTNGFRFGEGGAIGAGMLDRFGPGSPLLNRQPNPGMPVRRQSDQDTMIQLEQQGRARLSQAGPPVEGRGTRPSNSPLDPNQLAYTNRDPEAQTVFYRGTNDSAGVSREAALANPAMYELGDKRLRAAEAARREFRAANGLPNARQERDRRDQGFKTSMARSWLRRNGISPTSPIAKDMFPDIARRAGARMPAGEGEAATSSRLPVAGSPLTSDSLSRANTYLETEEPNNPAMAQLGLGPSASTQDIASGLGSMVSRGIAPTDDMLAAVQRGVQARDARARSEDRDEFDWSGGLMGFADLTLEQEVDRDLFRELARLPDDPKARADWAGRYAQRNALAEALKKKRESELPSQRAGAWEDEFRRNDQEEGNWGSNGLRW